LFSVFTLVKISKYNCLDLEQRVHGSTTESNFEYLTLQYVSVIFKVYVWSWKIMSWIVCQRHSTHFVSVCNLGCMDETIC